MFDYAQNYTETVGWISAELCRRMGNGPTKIPLNVRDKLADPGIFITFITILR